MQHDFEYYFSWYIPAHIAYVRLPSIIDYDYLMEANQHMLKWLDDNPANHELHLITDARDVVQTPHDILRLREVSTLFDHSRIGWALVVSPRASIRFLGATVPRTFLKRRTRAFVTMDAAVQFLHQMVQNVSWTTRDDTILHATIRG